MQEKEKGLGLVGFGTFEQSLLQHYVDSSKDGLVWEWLYSDWHVSQPVDVQSNQSQLFLDEAQKHSNSHVKKSIFLYVRLLFF